MLNGLGVLPLFFQFPWHQICTSPHVPIEERVRVRRSNGQFEEGVIVGYSAQKQLHCVRFKNEARWYRLSEIEYEVVEDDLLQ